MSTLLFVWFCKPISCILFIVCFFFLLGTLHFVADKTIINFERGAFSKFPILGTQDIKKLHTHTHTYTHSWTDLNMAYKQLSKNAFLHLRKIWKESQTKWMNENNKKKNKKFCKFFVSPFSIINLFKMNSSYGVWFTHSMD